jgi:uncharacterized integral membrane protein
MTSIIILNVGHTTNINLFFQEFQNISIVVVVFLSFILGVLYAFCYVVFWKIRKKLGGKKPKEPRGKEGKKDEVLPLQDGVPPLL